MPDVGSASLQIIPSFKGFEGNLEKGTSGAMVSAGSRSGARFGDSAGRSAGRRFGSVFRTVASAGLVGLGAIGVGAFKLGKDAIGQASELNESLNAVNVTYGKQSKAVQELGRQAADSLGLSNTEFNSLSVRFSSFAKTISGGDGPKIVSTLDDLTTRASDFASVMNIDVADAAEAFQSGLAGEAEPLKRFGLDLSDARIKSYAYANGIAKTGDELTEAQKVQARYGELMRQTSKTAGDFANTSDSLANRQRILNARWDDAQAKLGTALLPVMEDVSGFLLKEGIPAFEKASDWFVKDGIPAISDFASEMRPIAKEALPAVESGLKTLRDVGKETAPILKDLFEGFNGLPDELQRAVLIGAGVTAAAGKFGGFGGGSGGGGIMGLISKAKPMPVFVTNPGFGGGAGGVVPGAPGGKPVLPGGKLPAGAAGGGWLATLMGFPLPALGSDVRSGSPVSMPKNDLGRLDINSQIGASPSQKQIQDWVHYRHELEDSADAFKLLPDEVKTNIALNGAPESRAEARALVRQYDLTPKEKRTLFRVLDIEPSKTSTRQLQDVLARTPKGVNTHVTVSGVAEARGQVEGLIGALNNVATAADNALNHAANVALGQRGARNRTNYTGRP